VSISKKGKGTVIRVPKRKLAKKKERKRKHTSSILL